MNVKERTKRYWTEDPNIAPQEMAEEHKGEYKNADIAFTGS